LSNQYSVGVQNYFKEEEGSSISNVCIKRSFECQLFFQYFVTFFNRVDGFVLKVTFGDFSF